MTNPPDRKLPSTLVRALPVAVLASAWATSYTWCAAPAEDAIQLLTLSKFTGGLVVHVNCGDGKLTAALGEAANTVVHGLDRDAVAIDSARAHVRATGRYGRVSVAQWTPPELPYVDNLVNLLVVDGDDGLSTVELLRVVAPGGALCRRQNGRWTVTRKPRPADIDEWTHYLHDAGNNAVAHDTVVAPPRRLQWVSAPRWSRHHDRMASMSALVSAAGRVFCIMDEGSRASMPLSPKWKLIARDAFNGTLLWKRDIANWHFHLWPLKSGPAQLPRRLVAVNERVFATLGLLDPVSVLNAATGETVRIVDETAGAEELIYSQGDLFVMVNPEPDGRPFVPDRTGVWNDTRRVEKEYVWDKHPERRIVAVRSGDGRVLWSHDGKVAPLTLAADAARVYFYDGESVTALDRTDGRELWRSGPIGRRRTFSVTYAPALVVHDDVVLFGGLDNNMSAVSAETGKLLWTGKQHPAGHHSPRDILVVDGLAWTGAVASGRNSGVWTGYDLLTGVVKREFLPDVETYWFHHRCYRSKATDRYLLPSRTGIEFVDHRAETWQIHHWVRGGCIYGIMPCNGLVYAPPHSCACYLEAKLSGFNALAPAAGTAAEATPGPDAERLERGPAFGVAGTPVPAPAADWPTYRHDNARSGFTDARAAARLASGWTATIGGRLTSVVVAEGRLFVADIERHTVYALDARSGEALWQFTAGARVDSPPTIRRGTAIFGSADGWVYCLRADDGRLVWRYRAAPGERRLMAFDQLESVWPVHGSVLVRGDVVYCVAGRSMFLDGGMRLTRLEAGSGKLISETILDDRDPVSSEDLQSNVQVLNMPVALPDVLSCDGRYVYMRSQRFDLEGRRETATPRPTDPTQLAKLQDGDDRHLFSPAGFLDGAWFHRSYWLYGRRYSSGCNWWHRAGNVTPAGRLLAFNDSSVYGYGRKPEYFQWTVPLDYHLFAAERDPVYGGREITVAKSASLNPAGKPVSVAVWARPENSTGVVLVRGGASHGYGLMLRDGKPCFMARINSKFHCVEGKRIPLGQWVHLAGGLTEDKQLKLSVNGTFAAAADVSGLIAADPSEVMQIGTDAGSPVGEYERSAAPAFKGELDDIRIYHAALSEEDIGLMMARKPAGVNEQTLVLHFTFDQGDARDGSGNSNNGAGLVKTVPGKFGNAASFVPPPADRRGKPRSGSRQSFSYAWTQACPVHVRAMVCTPDVLFVAGPPDVLDEEAAYRDPHDAALAPQLAEQDAAFEGKRGGLLLAISATDGKELARYELSSPPRWDSMAVTPGRLFMTTLDGNVHCWRAARP